MELKIYTIENLKSKLEILSNTKRFIDIKPEDNFDVYIDREIDYVLGDSFTMFDDDNITLGENQMMNILDVHCELNTDISVGYGRRENVLELTDIYFLVKELYSSNINLNGFTFNWFKEKWCETIYLVFWNCETNQILLFY